jgi:hypothetical protein
LRPGLASIPGSMLLIASSPYRKAGVLYNVFARHFGKDDARTLVWRGTTLEMNPRLNPAVVEEAYADDPQSAASEYGAQFRDDISDFVSRDVVEACVIRGRGELLPARGITYHAFVDPSGGSSDSMTLAICHRDKDVAILDAVREIRPPFSPENAVQDFAATPPPSNPRAPASDPPSRGLDRRRAAEGDNPKEINTLQLLLKPGSTEPVSDGVDQPGHLAANRFKFAALGVFVC